MGERRGKWWKNGGGKREGEEEKGKKTKWVGEIGEMVGKWRRKKNKLGE